MQIETVIERKCMNLLHKAIAFKASDIHIVPEDEGYEVYFRKFGKLIQIEHIVEELGTRLITYLKFLSSLDIGESRKPQSGAFEKLFEEEKYSFRVSTLPSIHNLESVVIRVLLQTKALPIQQLTAFESQSKIILQLIERNQGLVLITGATGSGKTTTLYSLIHHCIHDYMRHVISLEDPVERTQQHMLQIQVNERAGVTYLSGLKAILRHTPDVIMIGEIRDRETAMIAVEAALTGHLVLATVHAKNAVGCLYRLMDLGISIEEMKQAVIGIMAQTLVYWHDIDDRKAIYEILTTNHLKLALKSIAKGYDYELPWDETIQGQIEKLETIRHVD